MRQEAEVVAMVWGQRMGAQPVSDGSGITPPVWVHTGWVKKIAAFAGGALLVLATENLASGRLEAVRWPTLPTVQVPAKAPGTGAPSARRGTSPTALA